MCLVTCKTNIPVAILLKCKYKVKYKVDVFIMVVKLSNLTMSRYKEINKIFFEFMDFLSRQF